MNFSKLTILVLFALISSHLKLILGVNRAKIKIKELQTILEVPTLEFIFPNAHEKLYAIKMGRYDPNIPIPIDVDAYYPGKFLFYLLFYSCFI